MKARIPQPGGRGALSPKKNAAKGESNGAGSGQEVQEPSLIFARVQESHQKNGDRELWPCQCTYTGNESYGVHPDSFGSLFDAQVVRMPAIAEIYSHCAEYCI